MNRIIVVTAYRGLHSPHLEICASGKKRFRFLSWKKWQKILQLS